jgi:hypothetical protein
MHSVNLWVVPVAAVSSFALGGLWYSPLTFGKVWERELRKGGQAVPSATKRVLAGSLAFTLIEAFAFAWTIGAYWENNGLVAPHHFQGWTSGLQFGLIVGGLFVAAATGVNYLFSGRSMKHLAIDGGFHVARYTLYGLVLGTWH